MSLSTERKFDRLLEFDEKSRQYSASPLAEHKDPRSYTWRCDAWLDQGSEGACVGFAFAHEAVARPVEVLNAATYQVAYDLYKYAQRVDPWPGENYEGTSVLAGAKAMKARGWLEEYRWAFSTEDALSVISRHGPAVIGVNWYSQMYDTDDDGYLRVGGFVVGGHALLVTGVNVKGEYVTLHNSWGQDWGVNGKARMSWSDFDRLLREQGECCIPVHRAQAA